MLLGQRDVPDRYDIRYLGTLTVVLAVVEQTLDLALVALGADGKNLPLVFTAENTNVLGFLLYLRTRLPIFLVHPSRHPAEVPPRRV